jgi:hypothetical protein
LKSEFYFLDNIYFIYLKVDDLIISIVASGYISDEYQGAIAPSMVQNPEMVTAFGDFEF